MYKIRHKATGKFLSEFGRMLLRSLSLAYPVESYLSKRGKHWVMKSAVDKILKRAEYRFPGEFEIVEYKIAE